MKRTISKDKKAILQGGRCGSELERGGEGVFGVAEHLLGGL
jgi:hypothetical protein